MITNRLLINRKLSFKNILIFLLIPFFSIFSEIALAQNHSQVFLANEYVSKGEIEKALEVYQELAKKRTNLPLIHRNYFELLISTKDFKKAGQHIRKMVRFFPGNLYYEVDRGLLYKAEGKQNEAERYLMRLVRANASVKKNIQQLSRYLYQKRMYDWAEKSYLEARKAQSNPELFRYELANLYSISNQKKKMIEEYLAVLNKDRSNISYIKSVWQRVLRDPKDLEDLEGRLIELAQENQGNLLYNELLMWTYLQQKNYYGAFIQARSIEKRKNGKGEKIYEIGNIAFSNGEFETAIEIYDHLINNYRGSVYYSLGRKKRIEAQTQHIERQFPVDLDAIHRLIWEYDRLIEDIGVNPTSLASQRNKAMLHAFYLGQYDSATIILEQVVKNPRTPKRLRMQSKLSLGDIYILSEKPWESALLYAQVEKEMKDSPIAYEAKLKNAKLSYYKGDFELAKGHLDILKEATSREIANDAMSLSLLIKDNTGLDSTETAMRRYAAIDLLVYQNRKDEALKAVDLMLKDYAGHSLEDELLWLKANILHQTGQFGQGVESLELLIKEFPDDILIDDAIFLAAKILEENLEDKSRAMEYYKQLMLEHPGSIYTAEARKRFRMLRGDA